MTNDNKIRGVSLFLFFTAAIARNNWVNTDVSNNTNQGRIPFQSQTVLVLLLCLLAC